MDCSRQNTEFFSATVLLAFSLDCTEVPPIFCRTTNSGFIRAPERTSYKVETTYSHHKLTHCITAIGVGATWYPSLQTNWPLTSFSDSEHQMPSNSTPTSKPDLPKTQSSQVRITSLPRIADILMHSFRYRQRKAFTYPLSAPIRPAVNKTRAVAEERVVEPDRVKRVAEAKVERQRRSMTIFFLEILCQAHHISRANM